MILHHDAGQQWRMNQEHIELIKLSDQPHINSQAVDTIKQYFLHGICEHEAQFHESAVCDD